METPPHRPTKLGMSPCRHHIYLWGHQRCWRALQWLSPPATSHRWRAEKQLQLRQKEPLQHIYIWNMHWTKSKYPHLSASFQICFPSIIHHHPSSSIIIHHHPSITGVFSLTSFIHDCYDLPDMIMYYRFISTWYYPLIRDIPIV